MSDERLDGWNKQDLAFNYAKDREFGPGLRRASLYADLGVAEATGGQFRAPCHQGQHGPAYRTGHDRHAPA